MQDSVSTHDSILVDEVDSVMEPVAKKLPSWLTGEDPTISEIQNAMMRLMLSGAQRGGKHSQQQKAARDVQQVRKNRKRMERASRRANRKTR